MDFYHSEGTSVLQYNFYDLQGSLLIFMQQAYCYDKCLEQEMATDSSSLAWQIPWIEKPGAGVGGAIVHRVAESQTRLSD